MQYEEYLVSKIGRLFFAKSLSKKVSVHSLIAP